MSHPISIQENSHFFWRYSTYISGALCLVFFLIFWNTTSAFWGSIFRFSSFILFALAVLGYLQIMNRPITVNLSSTDDHLIVSYKNKGKTIQEEQFDLKAIKDVIPTKDSQNIINSYLHPSSATLKIRFTDTEKHLYIFKFSGRPLFFERSELQEVLTFLTDKGIDAESV